eukprot:TRINITY_DN74383_c0_g1_i1.p1 TRINITY_DN74383_c0_g1~~TRINITY_DN74383_c0_g1_i1.p1  ORF type:complete len:765 (-),score=222.37 TRINITY_DN74383_c0_g1_i1:256-2550(-)
MVSEDAKCAGLFCGGLFSVGSFITLIIILTSIKNLGPEDQIVTVSKTGRQKFDGPQNVFISPGRETIERKAVRLGLREYAVVKDRAGKLRHVKGPQLFFMEAWDTLEGVKQQVTLQMNEYMRLVDKNTGLERVMTGAQTFVPGPREEAPKGTEECVIISPEVSVLVVNKTSGVYSVVKENGIFAPRPYEDILEVRKNIVINSRQYAVVQDRMKRKRTVPGPDVLSLEAYDSIAGSVRNKVILQGDEYVRLVDKRMATERIEMGPQTLVPEAEEEYKAGVEKAVFINATTTVWVLNKTSGLLRSESTQGLFFPQPYEIVQQVMRDTLLQQTEYAEVLNDRTGIRKTVGGPQLLKLDAYDVLKSVKPKIFLAKDQFVRLVDSRKGEETVIRGPNSVVPEATQSAAAGAEQAVYLGDDTAVLIRNKTSGSQQLFTSADVSDDLYYPAEYEHILETRSRIRVLPHEAVIVQDPLGNVTIYEGTGNAGTSFFIPPYAQVVAMKWSSYSETGVYVKRESVTRIDMRSRKMLFNFEVSTKDSVKLRIQGVIFWQMLDVAKMMKETQDPVGDVWQHCRTSMLQAVSAVKFENFLKTLSNVSQAAMEMQQPSATPPDLFYVDRGVTLTNLEVTSFECMEATTQASLLEQVRETTNKINRLQIQESQNEVAKTRQAGDLKLEQQRTLLLQQKKANDELQAKTAGEAAGLLKVSGAAVFIKGLEEVVPDEDKRVEIYKLREKVKARNVDTASISAFKEATLYMTPEDLNMKISEL